MQISETTKTPRKAFWRLVGTGIAATWLFANSAIAAPLGVLHGRDISGNAVASSDASAVFLYDSHLNITWLRDSGSMNGLFSWDAAVAAADNKSIGGFSDWRLPTTVQPDASCSSNLDLGGGFFYASGTGCTGSEMGHLWSVDLLNVTGGPVSTGDFPNLPLESYWSGTTVNPLLAFNQAWWFDMADGFQDISPKYGQLTPTMHAIFVRDGDVLSNGNGGGGNNVPEPTTLLLMGAGLIAIAAARRSRDANRGEKLTVA